VCALAFVCSDPATGWVHNAACAMCMAISRVAITRGIVVVMVTTSPTGAPRSLRQCHNDGAHGDELGCSARVRACMAWMLCFAFPVLLSSSVGFCTLRFWLVGIPPRPSPCAQRLSPCHLRVRVHVRAQRYSVRVRMIVAVPPTAAAARTARASVSRPTRTGRGTHAQEQRKGRRARTRAPRHRHMDRGVHTHAHTRTLYTRHGTAADA
jgi:hypothetical protein